MAFVDEHVMFFCLSFLWQIIMKPSVAGICFNCCQTRKIFSKSLLHAINESNPGEFNVC